MEMVRALDIRVGDVIESSGIGESEAVSIEVDEAGVTWITWQYGIKLGFKTSRANYWDARNPIFRVVNRTADTTKFTVIEEWDDADENDGYWPYPNHYAKSLIEGTLAERIRAKVGADWEAPVTITETTISGGWSEWTQENTYDFVIECAGVKVELDDGNGWDNGLSTLLKWLEA